MGAGPSRATRGYQRSLHGGGRCHQWRRLGLASPSVRHAGFEKSRRPGGGRGGSPRANGSAPGGKVATRQGGCGGSHGSILPPSPRAHRLGSRQVRLLSASLLHEDETIGVNNGHTGAPTLICLGRAMCLPVPTSLTATATPPPAPSSSPVCFYPRVPIVSWKWLSPPPAPSPWRQRQPRGERHPQPDTAPSRPGERSRPLCPRRRTARGRVVTYGCRGGGRSTLPRARPLG